MVCIHRSVQFFWAPTEFGMYELCYEENCNIPYYKEVEVTLPPTILLNETDVILCDGAEPELVADTTDAGDSGDKLAILEMMTF